MLDSTQERKATEERENQSLLEQGYDDADIAAVRKLQHLYGGVVAPPTVEWVKLDNSTTAQEDAPVTTHSRVVQVPALRAPLFSDYTAPFRSSIELGEMRQYVRDRWYCEVQRVVRTMYIHTTNTLRVYYAVELHTFEVWRKSQPPKEATDGETGATPASEEHL